MFANCIINIFLVSFLLCFLSVFPCSYCQTTPADKHNCKLNASSPFSYVVKITDDKKLIPASVGGVAQRVLGTASFGCLIGTRRILSTAWYYRREMKKWFDDFGGFSRFTVIGQNIWDYHNEKGYQNPCYQERKVVNFTFHPKAELRGERLYFDFCVIIMKSHFDVSTPNFPVMSYTSYPLDLLLQIRYLNALGDLRDKFGGCDMPVPHNVTPDYWTFGDRLDSKSIPFHTQCIGLLCEQSHRTPNNTKLNQHVETCKKKFNQKLNATILCMIPPWTHNIEGDVPEFPTNYAGIPVVCNETTLGIASQVKKREVEGYTHYTQDIFFTITLLRVYEWPELRKPDDDITTTTLQPPTQFATTEEFTTKREPTKDWGQAQFYRLPRSGTIFPPFAPFGLASSLYRPACFLKTLITSHVLLITLHHNR